MGLGPVEGRLGSRRQQMEMTRSAAEGQGQREEGETRGASTRDEDGIIVGVACVSSSLFLLQ
jgi:hypothetical protein